MKFPLLLFLFAITCISTVRADHGGAVSRFGGHAPSHYEAVSSVVFQYRWFKFPALGVMSVDIRRNNFALVGMSQIGINVFELSDRNGVVKCHMPGTLLERYPKIATGAVEDVRRMFFNYTPAPGAYRHDTAREVFFEEKSNGGTLQYRYDKATGLLLGKRFSVPSLFLQARSVVWVVSYENYAKSNGMTYAQVIRLKNRRLHYALSTRVTGMRIIN